MGHRTNFDAEVPWIALNRAETISNISIITFCVSGGLKPGSILGHLSCMAAVYGKHMGVYGFFK